MSLEVLTACIEAIHRGQPAAVCRLVATRGSTPQKAGAMMLAYSSGAQVGTLGGGCVEADVKRRALEAIRSGQSCVERFNLDHDFSWDDGLICGGRMDVLIDPLDGSSSEATAAFFEQLLALSRAGEPYFEAFVLDGSTAAAPARTWIVLDHHHQVVAQRHGELELIPPDLTTLLNECAASRRPTARAGFAVVSSAARCRLVIVGGGHVGQAVASLAANLDFDVWVLDDRDSIISPERFPQAERRIAGDIEASLRELDINENTYCLIVTRGHGHDEKALFHLANRGARYVGMIGSRRKIKLIFEDLIAEGVSPDSLANVHAPVGIDIGSQTVPEIAVSIAAELVAHRNLSGNVPGRFKAVNVPS